MRTILLFVAMLSLGLLASCGYKGAKMTQDDFTGFCWTQVNDDCRDVCDDFLNSISQSYKDKLSCRKACDNVAAQIILRNPMDDCSGSTGNASDLCSQYCDKNF